MIKSASNRLNLKGVNGRSRISLSKIKNLNILFDEFEEASMMVNYNETIVPLTMRRENGKIKCRLGNYSNIDDDFESCSEENKVLDEVFEKIDKEGLYFV